MGPCDQTWKTYIFLMYSQIFPIRYSGILHVRSAGSHLVNKACFEMIIKNAQVRDKSGLAGGAD